MTPFKPAITDPMFLFEKEDGTRADFDPWEFTRAIEESPEAGITGNADAVRKFLGYPTSADIAAASGEKPRTISIGVCQDLQAAVMDFIAELPSTKKKLQASQKLSAMGSNPRA